jgi:hypothetical protein
MDSKSNLHPPDPLLNADLAREEIATVDSGEVLIAIYQFALYGYYFQYL